MADSETITGDALVWKIQDWLNSTYGGRTGYINIDRDGVTGWGTINALMRAFQIELGISNTSTNFGPTTTSNFNSRFPNGIQQQLGDNQTEDNIYAIIQGACWCKGYSTQNYDVEKHFYSGVGSAISNLKSDAGCSNTSSIVTLNVMKALLSMDQFKKVSGGTDKIRTIQQTLNNKYESYLGLIPCDGLYSRQMSIALIKVLQILERYTGSSVDGDFGNGTKSRLPLLPEGVFSNGNSMTDEEKGEAILLLRYALTCNGYLVMNLISNEWDLNLEKAIKDFQNDMKLTYNGKADVDTWMSLLLSKGNSSRSCVACDTRFEMTQSRLQYLQDNGYQIVGRYLTGGNFKELRANEPRRILDKGIKFFPIFQESGTDLSYFTAQRGVIDAKEAVKAARIHGIPADNIIYFAVDTDPTGSQISTNILPYFKSISENISKSYRVGIYGTRNACTQVMEAGYAETCFVSDMSTGYSGNMGFKMPQNWNLDQFHEISGITTSDNTTMDLDKVAYSGKFPVVEDAYKDIIQFNAYIRELEELYVTYKTNKSGSYTTRDIILGITNFLRSFKYGNIEWYIASLTTIDDDFINYVRNNDISLYNNIVEYADSDKRALTDILGGYIDIGHLAATIEGYLDSNLVPNFWFGWGGDLASLMSQVDKKYDETGNTKTYLEIAKSLIGERSKFNYMDICSDADAIKIAKLLESPTSNVHPFSTAITNYYTNLAELRISYYLLDLNNVSLNFTNINNIVLSKMSGVFENMVLNPILGELPSTQSKVACCEAFAQYIVDNYPVI